MTPFHFEGQSHVLEAGPSFDHKGLGECGALPVLRDETGFLSVWKPTEDELATLILGGGVTLYVIGTAQPPVAIGVCAPQMLKVFA